MLRKKERLKKEDFNRFFSVGKRSHSPLFQLVFAPYPTFHASVVVPKKILRGAVARNKLRRQAYDVLRNLRPSGGVFILIAKAGAAKTEYALMRSDIESLLGRGSNTR